MYYVYILSCLPDLLYTGVTTDPGRRFRQHRGLLPGGAKFTAMHRPVSVAALWQVSDHSAALRLEARIKKLKRRDKNRLISEASPFPDLLPEGTVRLDPSAYLEESP